jgi:RHS repeat-associated protein
MRELVGEAGEALGKFADRHAGFLSKTADQAESHGRQIVAADARHADGITAAGKPRPAPVHDPKPGGEESPAGGPGHESDTGAPTKPSRAPSTSAGDAQEGAPREPGGMSVGADPVDVATGQVLVTDTDLDLPGVLPLRVGRTHLSGFGAGRSFGSRWASTLDQRLEAGPDHVAIVGEDASITTYPHPEPGVRVYPREPTSAPRTVTLTPRGSYQRHDPGSGWTWHYDRPAAITVPDGWYPLVAITDRNGNRLSFQLDESGRVAEINHSGGYRVTVGRDSSGRVTDLSVAGGDGRLPVRAYRYDARGRLVAVVDPDGHACGYRYDELARVVAWTDKLGYSYRYHLDDDGRCTRTESDDGALTASFTYLPESAGGLITTCTNSLGDTTTYRVDEHRRVTEVTDPLGATTRTVFDERGFPAEVTDPLDRVTRYRHSRDGDLLELVRPDGATVGIEYHDRGLPSRVTGFDGSAWGYRYDANGNPVEVTDPTGAVTRYRYHRTGAVAEMTDAAGNTTRIGVDAAGLPLSATDGRGGVTMCRRDVFGRIVFHTNPVGESAQLGRDREGRLIAVTHPDGVTESWSRDAEGHVIGHTDPLGAVTTWTYSSFDTVTSRRDPDGAVTRFRHDTELNLATVINPQGLTWRYRHDSAGRLTAETDFDDRTTRYRRDAAGQVIETRGPTGETTRYLRDRLGRVTTEQAPDGDVGYQYDAHGWIVAAVNPEHTIEFVRDPIGRVVGETTVDHLTGTRRTLTTTLDSVGRPAQRSTPAGIRTTWSYDAAGRVASTSTANHRVTHLRDAAGRETRRTLSMAFHLEQQHTPRGLMARQTLHTEPFPIKLGAETTGLAAEPRVLLDREFSYRPDTNLAGVVGHVGEPTGTRVYHHDPAGRVTSVQTRTGPERYSYDAAGNLTTSRLPDDSTPARAGYRGTRLLSHGRDRYRYDAAGRLVARTRIRLSRKPLVWTFTWDSRNRLRGVSTPDGATWRYSYDALGRRLSKTRLGNAGEIAERIDYTWDGDQLAEQTDAKGDALTWTSHPDNPWAPLTQHHTTNPGGTAATTTHDLITDQLGTPTHIVNPATRQTEGTTHSTLWGRVTPAGDTTPLRFAGQYHDPETGLHYNRFRYYNPDTGGYLSPDPLGLAGGPNPMGYVPNPTTWIDPLGLAKQCDNQPFPTRAQALDAALSRAGIPRRAKPDAEWDVGDDPTQRWRPDYRYDTNPGAHGHYMQFETTQGSRLIAEHTADPHAPMPHFHAGRPAEDAARSAVNFGWDMESQFERYKQVGGPHHYYYPTAQ